MRLNLILSVAALATCAAAGIAAAGKPAPVTTAASVVNTETAGIDTLQSTIDDGLGAAGSTHANGTRMQLLKTRS